MTGERNRQRFGLEGGDQEREPSPASGPDVNERREKLIRIMEWADAKYAEAFRRLAEGPRLPDEDVEPHVEHCRDDEEEA